MVDLYVTLILKGKRTFSQVPESLQEAVREELARRGYDINGKLLPPEEKQPIEEE